VTSTSPSAGTSLRPEPAGAPLSGVDALVRLLVLRHQLDEREGLTTATMVSGYPGSPLGTFDLVVGAEQELLHRHLVLHQPGLNEEIAVATVWGSQMGTVVDYRDVDGVAGVWYGKTPGLDRAGDALKHGNSMGSGPNGGVVLFCGDDPTAKSSTLASDSQHTFADACIPVLVPGDPQDILDLGVHAFRMSRFAGCWVGLKVVTAVADGIGTTDTGLDRHEPSDPKELVIGGQPWRHQPLHTVGAHAVPDQELLVVSHRLQAAKAYARHNGLDVSVGAGPGARLGIVCAGKTYYDLVQALADRGAGVDDLARLGVRVLKLAMTYPLVERAVIEFAGSVDEVLVVEEKRPFVETQLRAILHEAQSPVRVIGKRQALVAEIGELDPAAIGTVLGRVLPELDRKESEPSRRAPALPVAARPPGFCSGCPHNRSTVFPGDALVGGGVGCHGIMYFEARHAGMKSMPPTPMGAEGVPWIGLAPFVDEPHLIQNLGDGTLSHSGTLAIRASVAAGVNITFKILYNAAVAMTGGQDVTGLLDVPALSRALEAEGVVKVVVCAEDPGHYGRAAAWARGVEVVGRDRLPEVQEQLRRVEGVSVIIYDQRCAAEARRLRRRGLLEEPPQRVVINEAVCEGCGDCSVKSNCLSVLPVDTEFGEKRQIHDPSCNRDYTCLEGDCPSFVTLAPKRAGGGTPDGRRPRSSRVSQPEASLPEPRRAGVSGQFGIYFTGIGGTGVITANRIVAASAEAAGLVVGGMDQTGLSQRAGAVVSHLHVATDKAHLGSAVIGSGGADLYLSGDILQAAAERHLDRVGPGRTIAVVDRELTPTSVMLQTGAVPPAVSVLEEEIAERVGPGRVVFVDAKQVAERLLGNHMLANVVLLGAAYQMGGLPMSMADIETGIAGAAPGDATATREALEWGRWAVHDPAAVRARLETTGRRAATRRSILDPSARATSASDRLLRRRAIPAELRDLVTRRAGQVIDYQDVSLGNRYLELVSLAASHDGPDRGWELTRAVAGAWHKLLTYKDEYEVARLHLLADYDAAAADLGIDGPYSVTYHLHPPTLRRWGLKKKLPLGRPYEAGFRVLRRMKRLRGTPLDPFGRDPDRRMERGLIEEYDELVRGAIAAGLEYATVVAIAQSVHAIKGYGPVKEASVERWRARLAELQR
jgi:indolepyruvate ferredoxin oxidoreductase